MAEDDLERAKQEVAQRSRSNWMITIGLALFFFAGYGASTSPEGAAVGAILFGLLGVGLIVGGLVIRR